MTEKLEVGQYQGWAGQPRGLDLTRPDEQTLAEWEAWRANERKNRGWPLESYDMLAELGRGDSVKRWMLQIREFTTVGSWSTPSQWLQHYLHTGFEPGVVYEIQNCQKAGHSKDEVAEIIAVAFLHSVSGGLTLTANRVREMMRVYEEPAKPVQYPDSWGVDPDAFRSGLDFASPEMTAAELELLEAWYQRVYGEIPESFQFLSKYRPRLLKAWRNRFENTIRVLPKQMLPFLWLHYEGMRGHEAGIREAVLLARGFGMTRTQTVDPLVWVMLYGGHGAAANSWRAAGDVLDADGWVE